VAKVVERSTTELTKDASSEKAAVLMTGGILKH